MHPVLIFRHQEYEGPGYLQHVLHQNRIPYRILFIDQGEAVPESIDQCSALVFMGGPMSVNDDLPWIEAELNLIRQARDARLPVLGHCLGGQLISKAFGGQITANKVKEIGWLAVDKVDNAASNDWLVGLHDRFDVFHWHGETFSLPSDATLILKSDHCEHQAFVLDNILALQCHIEMQAPMVQQWAQCYADELQSEQQTVQSEQQMLADLEGKVEKLQTVADCLYQRWLQPLLKQRVENTGIK